MAGFEPRSEERSEEVGNSGFEMMRVLSEGHTGKVLLVRHKPTSDLFALKVIMKRYALAKKELDRALTEQTVLRRVTAVGSPFVAKLLWSSDYTEHLFTIMDFHPGGDLATQLARRGRLGCEQARFYAAEIVEGVGSLHKHGFIHRDLKPENVLIGPGGHIVLTDFGLSREFPRGSYPSSLRLPPDRMSNPGTKTTSTIRRVVKYTAPEVILGLPYSFEVDWWSFGVLFYEMLAGFVWTLATPLERPIC